MTAIESPQSGHSRSCSWRVLPRTRTVRTGPEGGGTTRNAMAESTSGLAYPRAMAKNEQSQATNIIFSYVPLLRGEPGQSYLGKEAADAAVRTAKKMEDLPSGSAKALLWTVEEDGTPGAMLLMEDADAIAEHLIEWSEGKPEDWFQFQYLEKGNAYAAALFPNFLKSAERWRIAFQLRYGYPPHEGGESHLFRPLHCTAPTKTAFAQVKPYLEKSGRVKVGLVDSSEVSKETWTGSLDGLKVRPLGTFKAVGGKLKKGLPGGWLEDAIDSMREAMREAGEL